MVRHKNIRAQRKFAQGAVVLPINPNTSRSVGSAVTRSSTALSANRTWTQGPIIKNKLQARDCLSWIALNKVHTHLEDALEDPFLQPKVLLTRFEPPAPEPPTPSPTKRTAPGRVLKKRKPVVRKSLRKSIQCSQSKNNLNNSGSEVEDNQPLINFTNPKEVNMTCTDKPVAMRKRGRPVRSGRGQQCAPTSVDVPSGQPASNSMQAMADLSTNMEASIASGPAAENAPERLICSPIPLSGPSSPFPRLQYESSSPEPPDALTEVESIIENINSRRQIGISLAACASTSRRRGLSEEPTMSRGWYRIPIVRTEPLSDSELTLEYDLNMPHRASELVRGAVVNGPVYRPTPDEFREGPIKFIKKIEPEASKYGICKIIPPQGFKIPCLLEETAPFRTTNQNVGRLFQRLGPASKELAHMQIHIALSERFPNTNVPMFEGVEMDLLELHRLAQRHGGLQELMGDRQKWAAIADEMGLVSARGRAIGDDKLQRTYMRHVLPYASLADEDRARFSAAVERVWSERSPQSVAAAAASRARLSGEDGELRTVIDAIRNIAHPIFDRIEECTTRGRTMTLQTFRRVASQLLAMHFRTSAKPSPAEVESAYWQIVGSGDRHVCVQTAAIDTSVNNLGHDGDPATSGGNHPWNLKRISKNPDNILRSLGQFLSVTVPTLCINQVFSTNCWHMDPHKLSWTDFMHEGATKIWYGVSRHDELKFRNACKTFAPAAVQNKSLWLLSDTAMVPPCLLNDQGCTLQRIEQNPGEYIVVFPGAYASSIATGMSISESIYFEDKTWLYHLENIFEALQADNEPAMFSHITLLMRMSTDPALDASLLPRVYTSLRTAVCQEKVNRAQARAYYFNELHETGGIPKTPTTWPYQEECITCRTPLVLSKAHRPEDPRQLSCLQHALHLYEEDPHRSLTLTLLYSDEQLTALLDNLRRRLQPNTIVIE